MRFLSLIWAFAVIALTTCVCWPTARAENDLRIEDLARRLDNTQRRLERIERELHALRERDAERQQWEASVLERLPSIETDLHEASFGGVEIDALDDFASQDCPDCGKPGSRSFMRSLQAGAGGPWCRTACCAAN